MSTVAGYPKHAKRHEESATPNPDPWLEASEFNTDITRRSNPQSQHHRRYWCACYVPLPVRHTSEHRALFLSRQGSRISPGRLVTPAGIMSGLTRHHLLGTFGWLNGLDIGKLADGIARYFSVGITR
jgi:hypothetical protein